MKKRKRIQEISNEELLSVIHLPQKDACSVLGVSLSSLKRIFQLRKKDLGYQRWGKTLQEGEESNSDNEKEVDAMEVTVEDLNVAFEKVPDPMLPGSVYVGNLDRLKGRWNHGKWLMMNDTTMLGLCDIYCNAIAGNLLYRKNVLGEDEGKPFLFKQFNLLSNSRVPLVYPFEYYVGLSMRMMKCLVKEDDYIAYSGILQGEGVTNFIQNVFMRHDDILYVAARIESQPNYYVEINGFRFLKPRRLVTGNEQIDSNFYALEMFHDLEEAIVQYQQVIGEQQRDQVLKHGRIIDYTPHGKNVEISLYPVNPQKIEDHSNSMIFSGPQTTNNSSSQTSQTVQSESVQPPNPNSSFSNQMNPSTFSNQMMQFMKDSEYLSRKD